MKLKHVAIGKTFNKGLNTCYLGFCKCGKWRLWNHETKSVVAK